MPDESDDPQDGDREGFKTGSSRAKRGRCRIGRQTVKNLNEGVKAMGSDSIPDAELDCVGLYCPMPIAQTKQEIDKLDVGQVLKVEADDPAAEEDIKRWAKRVGHDILKFEKQGTMLTFYIRKMK